MATTVCASCGAPQDVTALPDCENVEWHQADPEPTPDPALRGDDLVHHLQRERASLQDQVVYATRLLSALAVREPNGRLVVTMQELEAVDGMALRTWHDPATDAMVYAVQP